MMSIAFQLQARPQKRLELRQTLEAIMEETSILNDCLNCCLQQDPENLNAFALRMEWSSQQAFQDYQESEHFGVLLGAFNLLCSSKKIHYEHCEVGSMGP
jgi:quinol monooxygenase YgiN